MIDRKLIKYLKAVAKVDNKKHTDVYFSPNIFARWIFCKRLRVINELLITLERRHTCLEIGGGIGPCLPYCTALFHRVIFNDLDCGTARKVCQKLELSNVIFEEKNVLTINSTEYEGEIDLILAADVLEHFIDVELVLKKIKDLAGRQCGIILSLPTENRFYRLMRWCAGYEKPTDHYHDARHIERLMSNYGFHLVARRRVPFDWLPDALTLFSVTRWRKV